MKKSIYALIMARGGSKSIPQKNIVDLHGYPLLAWSIAACKLSKKIDKIILSTNDKKIAKLGKKYGAEVPFLRPEKYATDSSTDFDAINHCYEWFKFNKNININYIVQIRPTTPYRDPKLIDQAIKVISMNKSLTGLRSIYEMSESAWKTFHLDKTGILNPLTNFYFKSNNKELANLPRQKLPKTYFGQGYVDIIDTKNLKNKTLYGNKCFGFLSPDVGEIDNYNDLLKLRQDKSYKRLKILNYLRNYGKN
jgi:CMP-N,N'-diacetyllegionaminic acid synthase